MSEMRLVQDEFNRKHNRRLAEAVAEVETRLRTVAILSEGRWVPRRKATLLPEPVLLPPSGNAPPLPVGFQILKSGIAFPDTSMLITLVPVHTGYRSRGPYECKAFRAYPESFLAYATVDESTEPLFVDMHGIPYCTIGELVQR